MELKVLNSNQNGTLLILPDISQSYRLPVSFSAMYLTLSSMAFVSNLMVLSGILTSDRLRSSYAVLVSALCLQCALDSAISHFLVSKELLTLERTPETITTSSITDNSFAATCRVIATITSALSTVELITLATLTCLNTFARTNYILPLPAAAVLWAVPSMYTYVILTPTLLFSTRYFSYRGRCGFTANSTEWFYPTLLITFSLMIPWSISFYFVFISRPSSATIRATRGLLISSDLIRSQPEDLPSKWIFSLYTVFVTPGYLSSCSFLYKTQDENIWIENKKFDSILDGYLSKLPIIFDLIVPLVLIYYHKAFRKKCRDLYLHGFRNSVSDDSQMMKKRISNRRIKEDKLINDSPVLFLENSGIISLRIPKDNGFIITTCDVDEDGNAVNKKKYNRFSRRVSKAIGSNSKNINENEEFQNEESQF